MTAHDCITFPCCNCSIPYPRTTEYFHRDKRNPDGLSFRCKACACAKSRQWHAENTEYAKEQKKVYYRENKAAYQAYRVRNAEVIAQQKRAWRAANPEKARKHRSDSQRRNRAAATERVKRWRRRHPEKSRQQNCIQQHRRNHAPGKFTLADVEMLLRTQKGLCWWCGCTLDRYEIDHRVPVSRGGTNDPSNLCLACPPCNQRKNAKLPHEWNGRLL